MFKKNMMREKIWNILENIEYVIRNVRYSRKRWDKI